MNSFLHQASFATGYWCYDRHRSVRLVVLVGLANDQIAQSGLSSLSVIYYSAQLFSLLVLARVHVDGRRIKSSRVRHPGIAALPLSIGYKVLSRRSDAPARYRYW
ncbi:hypothetical protein B1209_24935 [Raoultella planticola]|nr:hypothetical protein B1209_24935 [Raoultella planticola]